MPFQNLDESIEDEVNEADFAADAEQVLAQAMALEDLAALPQSHIDFHNGLNLNHFSARELFYLGDSHHGGGDCGGKNALPPEAKLANISETIKIVDELRAALNEPIRINSGFRNEDYNGCVGGASESLHKAFNAIDFTCSALQPKEYAIELRKLRDAGRFRGGIGVYNSFVHIDTRGVNKNFKGKTTPQSIFDEVFG